MLLPKPLCREDLCALNRAQDGTLKLGGSAVAADTEPAAATAKLGDPAEQDRPGEARRLTPAQRQAAKYLARCEAETVRVTVYGEADVSAILQHRAAYAGSRSVPTITHYLLAALARALAVHREFNAHFSDFELTRFETVDVAVAVAMENGDLVTPVLRDVGAMSLDGIRSQGDALVNRVRAGGMTLADTRGAGFTLSNLGRPKVAQFATPIIPVPQVAILAATAIRLAPVVRDGTIVATNLLPLSLSFDHRAINGVTANAFLDTLGEMLGNPQLLEEPQP